MKFSFLYLILFCIGSASYAQVKVSFVLAQALLDPAQRSQIPLQTVVVQSDYLERLQSVGPTAPMAGSDSKTGQLQMSQIADANGNIVLFRTINGNYTKNYYNKRNIQELGMHSFSASPDICGMWGNADSIVLIAIQNIKTNILRFPNNNNIPSDEPAHWSTLHPETRISDIAYYDEIDVPVPEENVIVTFPAWKCEVYIQNYWRPGVDQKNVVLNILKMPNNLPSDEDARRAIDEYNKNLPKK